jgi:hypothetical protein
MSYQGKDNHSKLILTLCIDWAQLSRFYLKTETIQAPKRCVLKNKHDGVLDQDRTMDNVQKHNIYTDTVVFFIFVVQ